MMSRNSPATWPSAASRLTGRKAAERSDRVWAWFKRFGVVMISAICAPLGQIAPSEDGWALSPLTSTTRWSRTFTRRPQPTPQYGQMVLTTVSMRLKIHGELQREPVGVSRAERGVGETLLDVIAG